MERETHGAEKLIWILLFFAFASCVVASLLQGARIYNSVSAGVSEEFGVHTALNYVESRVRASDLSGCVYVGAFDGCSALYCLDGPGSDCATVIYCYGGALRELYYERGGNFAAGDGEVLLAMDSASFSDAGGLILFTCAKGGKTGSVYMSARAAGGAV